MSPSYPHKTDEMQHTLKRLSLSLYSVDDMPYLSTQRYSINPDYDPGLMVDKQILDNNGCQENLWWRAQYPRETS